MRFDEPRAYWLEVGGLALASLLLFRFGLLALVFLVPVQLAWVRRGEEGGLIASGGVLAGIALMKVVDLVRIRRSMGGADIPEGLLLLDLVFAAGLLAGLFVLNSDRMTVGTDEHDQRELTVAERMLAAIGVGAVVYGPTVAMIAVGDAGASVIAAQIEVFRPLFETAGATTEEIRVLVEIVVGALLSGLLFGYFLMLVGNWWFGVLLAFRSRFTLPAGNPIMARLAGYELTEFRLPVYLVWALIGAWGGVLLTELVEVGWLSYVFWNAAFTMLALYAIQGVAIVWYYLDRRGVGRGARIGLAIGMVFGLLIPGVQLAIGLGLPGLGVSEIWIDYHRFQGSEEGQ